MMKLPLINLFPYRQQRLHQKYRLQTLGGVIDVGVGVFMAGLIFWMAVISNQMWVRYQTNQQLIKHTQQQAQKQKEQDQERQKKIEQQQKQAQSSQAQHQALSQTLLFLMQHLPSVVVWNKVEWIAQSQRWRLVGKVASSQEGWMAYKIAKKKAIFSEGLQWKSLREITLKQKKSNEDSTSEFELEWYWSPPLAKPSNSFKPLAVEKNQEEIE